MFKKEKVYSGSFQERGGNFSVELFDHFGSLYGLCMFDHGGVGCVVEHAKV